MKSALDLSNEYIANELGISRNTVLKWGKEIENRLAVPYEMLFRLLAAELLGVMLMPTLSDLRAKDKAQKINVKAV